MPHPRSGEAVDLSSSSGVITLDPRTPDYNIDPWEVPHFFDLSTSTLLVGEEAYTESVENGANPETIHALGALLVNQAIELDPQQFESLDTSNWPLPLYDKFGTWLHKVVTPPDATFTNISKVVIGRARRLGLGSSFSQIVHNARYGSLTNFIEAIDVVPQRKTGKYDHWSHEQFVQHTVDTFLAKTSGSLKAALLVRSRANDGPNPEDIRRKAGSPMTLLAERGYANVDDWDNEDALDWGAMFMIANEGAYPTARQYAVMSPNAHSSTHFYITKHFDNLPSFNAQAHERYPGALEAMQSRSTEYIGRIETLADTSPFLDILRDDTIPTWLRARLGAQYLLVHTVRSELPNAQKMTISSLTYQDDYLKQLFSLVPRDKIDQLRGIARDIGVEADVWPKFNPEFLWMGEPWPERIHIHLQHEHHISPTEVFPSPFDLSPPYEDSYLQAIFTDLDAHMIARIRDTMGMRIERKPTDFLLGLEEGLLRTTFAHIDINLIAGVREVIRLRGARRRLTSYILEGEPLTLEVDDVTYIPEVLELLPKSLGVEALGRRREIIALHQRTERVWMAFVNIFDDMPRFRHSQAVCQTPGKPSTETIRERLEVFHPQHQGNIPRTDRAEIVECAHCKATNACLDFAFTHNIKEGVWGGLNKSQRRRVGKTFRHKGAEAAQNQIVRLRLTNRPKSR